MKAYKIICAGLALTGTLYILVHLSSAQAIHNPQAQARPNIFVASIGLPDGPYDDISQQAIIALGKGDDATAIADYKSDLLAHPRRPDLLVGLGRISQSEGKLQDAIALEKEINAPDEPQYPFMNIYLTFGWLDLSAMYCQIDDWNDAVSAYNQVPFASGGGDYLPSGTLSERTPSNFHVYDPATPEYSSLQAAAYIAIGELYDDNRQTTTYEDLQARKYFDLALKLEPNSDRVKFFHAYGLGRSGDMAEATDEMTALLNSSSPDVSRSAALHLAAWKNGPGRIPINTLPPLQHML